MKVDEERVMALLAAQDTTVGVKPKNRTGSVKFYFDLMFDDPFGGLEVENLRSIVAFCPRMLSGSANWHSKRSLTRSESTKNFKLTRMRRPGSDWKRRSGSGWKWHAP